MEQEDYEDSLKVECSTMVNLLNWYRMFNDKYFRLLDKSTTPMILYTHNGMLYRPKCIDIYKIFILENTSKCYDDIPIIFNDKSKNVTGFLSVLGLIKDVSREVKCDNFHTVQRIPKSNYVVIRSNNEYHVEEYQDDLFVKLNYFKHRLTNDYKHSEFLTESVNLLTQSQQIELSEEHGEHWFISKITNSEINNLKDTMDELSEQTHQLINNTIISLITSKIVLIPLICLMIIGSLWFYVKLKKISIRRKRRPILEPTAPYIELIASNLKEEATENDMKQKETELQRRDSLLFLNR